MPSARLPFRETLQMVGATSEACYYAAMRLGCYLDAKVSAELMADEPAFSGYCDSIINREIARKFGCGTEIKEHRRTALMDENTVRVFFSVEEQVPMFRAQLRQYIEEFEKGCSNDGRIEGHGAPENCPTCVRAFVNACKRLASD